MIDNEQAIKILESQFEEAKFIQNTLQKTQTNEEYNRAIVGIHAMGIVLDLAKKYIKENAE